jgi:hypothetical protein
MHHHWLSSARTMALNRTIGWLSKHQILKVIVNPAALSTAAENVPCTATNESTSIL